MELVDRVLDASPTHFAVAVAGVELSDPPADRKGRIAFGTDPLCWLCGGDTEGQGWPQPAAIAPTFTQVDFAVVEDSGTVCRACAALTKAATFQEVVRARGMDVKLWTQAGWHCYSHLFVYPDVYECPKPSRVRELLLDPPDAPFLLCINATGQKHTIFRGRIATSRDLFPVHYADETFDVSRVRFAEVLETLEALSALGISKDQSVSGRYHPESLRRAGLAAWRPLEERMKRWRDEEPMLLALVHWCGRSPSSFTRKKEEERS